MKKVEYGKHQKTREDEKREKIINHRNSNDNVNNNPLKNMFSKKIIKKNQVALLATSLMLVTAGYLNYSNNIKMAALGDAQLVSANIVENLTEELEEENNDTEEISVENEEENVIETMAETEEVSEDNTLETASQKNTDEYFTKTKLERDTMYSQMLETYQKILENSNIPNDQKSIASNEIKTISDRKNAIATIENLMKVKGFEDVVILINENSINIVVKTEESLTKEQIAQIVNIVSRELDAELEDIHITTK